MYFYKKYNKIASKISPNYKKALKYRMTKRLFVIFCFNNEWYAMKIDAIGSKIIVKSINTNVCELFCKSAPKLTLTEE